jgi:hypothetical protein
MFRSTVVKLAGIVATVAVAGMIGVAPAGAGIIPPNPCLRYDRPVGPIISYDAGSVYGECFTPGDYFDLLLTSPNAQYSGVGDHGTVPSSGDVGPLPVYRVDGVRTWQAQAFEQPVLPTGEYRALTYSNTITISLPILRFPGVTSAG